MRTLSGVQSSGKLHIGNYFGAIRQFVQLQEEGEAYYFIANLHALTTVRDAKLALELTREAALAYLALGVDPKKAVLFRQSDVREVLELNWILGTVVPHAHLERAHSYKDKVAKGISPDFGLFAYPVLMAADILLYSTDFVPVGKDQIQHVEFARDWAVKFNTEYVKGYDPADPDGKERGHAPGILKLPQARIQEATQTVPGVDGKKMSKSYGNTIEMFGDEKEIKKRIMSIKTDSTPVEAPKPVPEGKPADASLVSEVPLYDLLKLMLPASEFAEVDASWRAGGKGYGEYKKKLLEAFHTTFGPARQRYAELAGDPAELERILQDGAQRARQEASVLMDKVRRAVGIP
ncbi:tryptophan--tRNA ligase [Myxococcus sp. MISCRS1]|jgi:tryptophanyl-tRNA synthetase|uniref:tryptophan--tRNA ligase n=2 Tax=Myxococcaceae TaxID=31 RepID=UPI001CC14010|nr:MULTISPECIES: tryptophan--tRNA ligase [Myxococcus]BDT34605.1 tryptophan--tRNA ligase [Myxococcus sp. MH1]MBZ4397368.1 tryptophan--tRNA ligase [Myxococcus sp. AS-1-15]MBZ4410661.1 tryptophan--tRNA ligase [Myxococcus sp. XM-1-1-1]MCK8498271.1 tryptophan--tRNA ligase [Myxococcus fulvus]MCY1003806.1 tryptophan--tRNA ligase [Myxococcus sp. MISCRS1]